MIRAIENGANFDRVTTSLTHGSIPTTHCGGDPRTLLSKFWVHKEEGVVEKVFSGSRYAVDEPTESTLVVREFGKPL
jgi:hypothetical protein